jgi:chemotaxis signal transduction protein
MTKTQVRFEIGDEVYALPVEHVLEVTELGYIAAVPGAPTTALGVTNLRGEVLPVFDLARTLEIERSEPPASLVVTEYDNLRAGLAIDAVIDVGQLEDADEPVDSDLLSGAVIADGALVGVIDVARLFEALRGAGTRV